MKKFLNVVLILLIVLTFVTGCSSNKETNGKVTKTDLTEKEDAEPTKILWSINDQGTGTNPKKDGIVVKAIEEKFNVDITFFESNYIWSQEQFNLKIASGEIPDVWYDYGHNTWYREGVIRTITEDMIKKNMPKTYQEIYLKQDPDKLAFKVRTVEGGKLLGLPSITIDGASCFVRVYRQDWLEKLQLNVPTNLEELEEVFRAFTKSDPDGNEEDDTYGVNTEPNRLEFDDVFGTFGILPGAWLLKDDKVVRSDTMEEYKEGLRIIARWYKEGYINPECVTDSFETFVARFADGEIGSYYLNYRWVSPDQPDSPAHMLLQKDPEAKLVYGDAIKGPNGESGAAGYGPDLGWTVVFRKNLPDELVIKVMQIIEYFNTTDEGFKLTVGGVEGKTYEIDDEGKIKTIVSMEELVKEGIGTFPRQTHEKFIPLKWGTGKTAEIFELGVKQNWIKSETGSMPFNKAKEKGIGIDIDKVYDEFYWNVITGKINIDDEWNTYLKKLKDNGIDELTEEANEIYNFLNMK